MNGDGIFDVAAVSAAHHNRYGHIESRACPENHFVTLRQSPGAHPQAAQLVVLVRIRARDIKRDVETIRCKRNGQSFRNRGKVAIIGGAVGQRDVERAAFFSEWKVVRAVHRKRKDVGLVTKNRRRTVSLVHVGIEDDGAPDSPFLHEPANGNRDVIEDAVSFAVIGICVVRTAGEVDGKAVVQRGTGSAHGRTHGATRSFDHLRGPGKTDPPLFVRVESSFGHSAHIRRVVREGELRIRRRRRLGKLMWRDDTRCQHTLAQPAVFRHREAVTRRQGQYEMISVENLHARDRLR